MRGRRRTEGSDTPSSDANYLLQLHILIIICHTTTCILRYKMDMAQVMVRMELGYIYHKTEVN